MRINPVRLRLKGDKKRKRKNRDRERRLRSVDESYNTDLPNWTNIRSINDLNGPIVILTSSTGYASALNIESQRELKFTKLPSGSSISEWAPDSTTYVLIPTKISGYQFTLKLPTGKYLGIDSIGGLICERNAVGQTEIFELVTREDGFSLKTFKGFISCSADGTIRADSDTIGSREVFTIKTQQKFLYKEKVVEERDPVMEGSLEDLKRYLIPLTAKYQNSNNSESDIIAPKNIKIIKKARKEGLLHEALLDIREKSKSDKRYFLGLNCELTVSDLIY